MKTHFIIQTGKQPLIKAAVAGWVGKALDLKEASAQALALSEEQH